MKLPKMLGFGSASVGLLVVDVLRCVSVFRALFIWEICKNEY